MSTMTHPMLQAGMQGTLPSLCPTHLDEGAEGGIGGVVGDKETHVLIADLHGGGAVHPSHGQNRAGDTDQRSPPKLKRSRRLSPTPPWAQILCKCL